MGTASRRLRGTLIAGLLLTLVSACGDAGPGQKADSSSGGMTAASFYRKLSNAMSSANSARFTMKAGVASAMVTIRGEFVGIDAGSVSAMKMQMSSAGQQIQEILISKTLYLKSDALTNDHWIKVNLGNSHNPLSKMLSSSANPAMFTDYLKALRSFKDEGSATLDGKVTEHYVINVDTQKAQANNPLATDPQVKAELRGLPKTTKVNMWVDNHNLPAKFAASLGKLGSYSMTFTDWGKPVSIQPPPSNQVTSIASH
jgi:hypothetical protein